jgi:hypothetical protein
MKKIIVKWKRKQNVHNKTSGEDSDIITYAISNSLTYMSKNISQRTEVIVMVFDYPVRRGVDYVHNIFLANYIRTSRQKRGVNIHGMI